MMATNPRTIWRKCWEIWQATLHQSSVTPPAPSSGADEPYIGGVDLIDPSGAGREKPVILVGMPTIERLNRGETVELEQVTLLHADNMVGALERREALAVAGAIEAVAQALYKEYVWCDVSEAEKLRDFVLALTTADQQAAFRAKFPEVKEGE